MSRVRGILIAAHILRRRKAGALSAAQAMTPGTEGPSPPLDPTALGWFVRLPFGRLRSANDFAPVLSRSLDTLMRRPPPRIPGVAGAILGPPGVFAWRDPRLDAVMESYVEWREESQMVETAYERWAESERFERGLAYAAYRAALDREEKAAGAYALAATRLLGAARRRRPC